MGVADQLVTMGTVESVQLEPGTEDASSRSSRKPARDEIDRLSQIYSV